MRPGDGAADQVALAATADQRIETSIITHVDLGQQAAAIVAEHQAARSAIESAVSHAVRAGELLIQAKAAIPHGGWGSFCNQLPFSDRTARAYMQLAGLDQAKRQRVAEMTLREALASISEPKALPAAFAPSVDDVTVPVTDEHPLFAINRQVIQRADQLVRLIRSDPVAGRTALSEFHTFMEDVFDRKNRLLAAAGTKDIRALAYEAGTGASEVLTAMHHVRDACRDAWRNIRRELLPEAAACGLKDVPDQEPSWSPPENTAVMHRRANGRIVVVEPSTKHTGFYFVAELELDQKVIEGLRRPIVKIWVDRLLRDRFKLNASTVEWIDGPPGLATMVASEPA